MPIPRALVADLRRALPPDTVVTESADLPAYGRDWREARGVPGVVVRPREPGDVATTLRWAADHGVPVAPRAAGTNAAASFLPTPERILLDLRTMDRVLSVDPDRREAVVQPGVINGDLNVRVTPLGLGYAADPASAPLSTIGGNIMTNAGGPHCLKHGVTFHQIRGVACVLVGGDTLHLRAEDAGPDLLGVVIGSEGTLAVVVEATLRLRPVPEATRTLLATFSDAAAAAQAVFAVLATGVVPAALEYADAAAVRMFDRYAPSGYPADAGALLLVDLDGSADEVAADLPVVEAVLRRGARDVRRADGPAAREALWRGRLHAAQAIVATGQQHHLGDATVPPSRLPDLQRAIDATAVRHGLAIPTLGHAGDGNLHPIILFDGDDPRQRAAATRAEEELIGAALGLGGTISGEHGIGSEKRHSMARHFRPVEIAAMRAKAAFDPADLLNPGIGLPPPTPGEPPVPRFAAAVREAVAGRQDDQPGAAPVADTAPTEDPEPVALDLENRTITVNAATPLRELHATLAAHDLRSPLPDGPGTVGAAVGDDPTARASVRDTLLGVRAVLPNGPAVRFGSGLLKDVAGYDLKRLFTGGGARFGTLQAVTLRAQVGPGR